MYVRAILLFHSSAGQIKKGENHDFFCEWTYFQHTNFNKTNPFIVILLLIFSSRLSFNDYFLCGLCTFYDSYHFVQIIFC
jgi:hypothetical protein